MAPREVTGRKKPSPPLDELMAYSIKQFCALHGISIDTYFRMRRQGHGPATMAVGQRTLISAEAAAAWRRAREQAVRPPKKQQVKKTATARCDPQEMGAA
jgi:hypothetical protein